MCLYSKEIKNKKYEPNIKNNGVPEICQDKRKRTVNTKCGRCIECRRERKREWMVRLSEEVKANTNNEMKFVTLTISEEYGEELETACKSQLADDVARIAIRRFTERWRKEFKKAPRHWLSTELGGKNTERLHFHGFIWGDEADIVRHWKYGNVMIGGHDKNTGKRIHYISEKSINYMTKYIMKVDKIHPTYQSKLFTSKGMGIRYIETEEAKKHKFEGENTKKKYKTSNGLEVPLPLYYRTKLWSDEERDKLWTVELNKDKLYVMGSELKNWKNISEETEIIKRIIIYKDTVDYYRKINQVNGYGTNEIKWKQKEYTWRKTDRHYSTQLKNEKNDENCWK